MLSLYDTHSSVLGSVDFTIVRPSTLLSSASLIGAEWGSMGASGFDKIVPLSNGRSSVDNPSSFGALTSPVDAGLTSTASGNLTGTTPLSVRSGLPLTTSDSFLESPTLADVTDKILPTEQTLAHQKFVNPQSTNSFFGGTHSSELATGRADSSNVN